jgi:hypothetical protein
MNTLLIDTIAWLVVLALLIRFLVRAGRGK